MMKAQAAQPAPAVVRMSYVKDEQQIRELKQHALRVAKVKLVDADVRASCGFMPMNIKGAVAHWRGL